MEKTLTSILHGLEKTRDYLEKKLEKKRENPSKVHVINHWLYVTLTIVAYSYDNLQLAEMLVILTLLSIRFRLSSGFKG